MNSNDDVQQWHEEGRLDELITTLSHILVTRNYTEQQVLMCLLSMAGAIKGLRGIEEPDELVMYFQHVFSDHVRTIELCDNLLDAEQRTEQNYSQVPVGN